MKEIHNKLKPKISDDDIELGLVDGPGDIGIDFIHKDDGHVTIIQAKYRGPGTKEPHEDVSYFQSALKRLSDSSLKISDRLHNKIGEIDLHNDSISLIYLTFGEIANQAKTLTRQEPAYPNGFPDLDQRCDWEFIDESALNEEIRTALSSETDAANKTISLYPQGAKGKRGSTSIIQVQAGEYRSFVMVLDARQIIRAYQEADRDALFSLNIRNFIGKTSTNKAIMNTAKDRADSFFYLTMASHVSAGIWKATMIELMSRACR